MFAIGIVSIFLTEFIILANTTFTLWPEIVLYPWLQNNGFLLYKDIINPYFPLLIWILSLLTKTFGYDHYVFIYFTWGYIFLTQLIFIFIVQKLFQNRKITFFSFTSSVILTIIFEGNGMWFDMAVSLPLFSAFYFLVKKKYLYSGICFGIGLLIKQTVGWAIVGSLLFIVGAGLRPKKTLLKTMLLLLPIIILVLSLFLFFYLQGIFSDFYFWSIKLPFGLMQKTSGFVELPTKRNIIIMLAAFWPIIIYIPKLFKDKISSLAFIFFLSTLAFAFPRFGYFHLVAALPFFSIITAKILLTRKIIGGIYLFSVGILLIFTVKRTVSFSIRFFDKNTYKLAKIINKETKGESFFLQNSPQQIYFINNILPPKPWAINFPWYFEYGGLQQRTISGIEKNRIKYIVFKSYQHDFEMFTPGTYKPKITQNYIDKYFLFKRKIESNMYIYEKNN